MNIDIRSTSIDVGAALEEHIERSVRRALGARGRSVLRIVVRLTDVNGPKGGLDKHCHIITHLPGHTFVVHDFAEDPYVAVSHASARLGEIVTSVISRERERRVRPRLPVAT